MKEFSLKYEILEKKGIPIDENQLSYWGPINPNFSDSFLNMANVFLDRFYKSKPLINLKKIFSSFVELVQNVAEYNEKNELTKLSQSFMNLSIEDDYVSILTSNQILECDVSSVKTIFNELFSLKENEVLERHKKALLNNESLGLLMIKKLQNAEFYWELIKDNKNNNWLNVKLKVYNGDITY